MSWAGYFKCSKPTNPVDGDQWFNEKDNCIYMWLDMTQNWEQMTGQPGPPMPTMKELMDLYPDFKELADKYTEWEILKRSGKQNDSIQ
jgi:hypothetical protein